METFSAYARQFIGEIKRPDVDKIEGLSPVIAIEQKTVSKNPRSTVGTITEVYDFLRLLFSRAGVAYSYINGNRMQSRNKEAREIGRAKANLRPKRKRRNRSRAKLTFSKITTASPPEGWLTGVVDFIFGL